MKQKTPIAVVGMAGVFPGASDLDTFWQNIIHKKNSCSEVPKDRWIVNPDAMYHPSPAPDKAFSKRACLIRDFTFDPKGIDLDPELLTALDPLYQIVLHAGRDAFSSCTSLSLADKKRIGVSLAAIALPTDASSAITRKILGRSFEERFFPNQKKRLSELSRLECLNSRVTSLPGAILARGLGLGGGSFTLDAACASSLYAVKLACDELQSFRADAMLAGGVSRPECLYTQVGFSQLHALSRSGRCAPFDESADGLVVGEGAGILVLKRLDHALRNRDTIYAVIRGIGLSNDMRGNLLAPDSEGQVRAMQSAYESAGLSPYDVDMIECHGAGTPVGDTTELRSLRNLWGESGWSHGQCAIGSVKSMIGHLLTAAGAAGMIKSLLGLHHKTLPPSMNFRKASAKSPLNDGPFRVQTEPEKWSLRNAETPRRAAVSAFGFGGINAHLLFETFEGAASPTDDSGTSKLEIRDEARPDVAIVGMDAKLGSLTSLRELQEAIFRGDTAIRKRPETRWKGSDSVAKQYLGDEAAFGGYLDDLAVHIGDFRIPPNEIPDILPQQLLMLQVSAKAMADAGLPLQEERPRVGVIIGMEFDWEATNFHLRWNLHNEVQVWKTRLDMNDDEAAVWLESLRDSLGPPLTPTRTLGALGGIVASRIAREFRFGGPSYVVSAESASGLKALEIGLRSLQQNETDAVLVGAIDLAGDIRNVITTLQGTSETSPHIPGEGAAALILKRLDQAVRDGDRIYSVIRGIGNASGGDLDMLSDSVPQSPCLISLERAFQDANVPRESVSFIETSNREDMPYQEFFTSQKSPYAIGSVMPNIGNTNAAAGLASVIKTSLCLYQEIIPPLEMEAQATLGNSKSAETGNFHLPVYPQFWMRNRADGPRRACVSTTTSDGNCAHAILEGFEYAGSEQVPAKVIRERKRPLGLCPFGLFIVEGDDKNELITGLDALLTSHFSLLTSTAPIESLALDWYRQNGVNPQKKHAVSIVAGDVSQLEKQVAAAKDAVLSDTPQNIRGSEGVCYTPNPLGESGEIAFVFPGSGNHYVGMGRDIGIHWPEVLRKMDA
ncbi:MAG: hypothetical protein B6245_11130, partial [Desulfobacteraceae bacterium 4572_88]